MGGREDNTSLLRRFLMYCDIIRCWQTLLTFKKKTILNHLHCIVKLIIIFETILNHLHCIVKLIIIFETILNHLNCIVKLIIIFELTVINLLSMMHQVYKIEQLV
jgi:hypothetical protein